MAIDSADEIIGQFRRIFPECDSSQAQVLLQSVHQELCEDLPIMTDRWRLRLTGGQQEYEVGGGDPWFGEDAPATAKSSVGMLMLENCVYRSNSMARELQVTSHEELTATNPNWRQMASGTPQYVYTFTNSNGSIVIGLHPAPDSSSSGADGTGLPRIEIRSRISDAENFTGSALKPLTVRTHLIYVYGMGFHYSLEQNNGRQAEFMQMYQFERSKVSNLLYGRQRQYKVNFRPAMPTKGLGVV